MTPFLWAMTKTRHLEGGETNDPDDPGGYTAAGGVSLRFLKSIGEDIDHDGDVDEDDVKLLSKDPDKVILLYHKHFWLPNRLEEVPSELLSSKIFDMAFNMGASQAWKIVQRASGRLTADGVVGDKSIEFLKQSTSTDFEFLGKIRAGQTDFYLELIKAKPVLVKYKLGWLRRAVT